MKLLKLPLRAAALASALFATSASAGPVNPIAPAELLALMDSPSTALVVDLRPEEYFLNGSIPGAVHIPAAFIGRRNFPLLDAIVLVDDGVGLINGRTIAEELGARVDFPVLWLRGGYAAWLESRAPNTAPSGLRPESLPRLTYRQLTDADLEDAVLFDLRFAEGELAPAGDDDPVSKFAGEMSLPLARGNPLSALGRQPSAAPGELVPASAKPLLVLIDNNDGTAEAMARKLQANGHHRFVILTGGAEIIRHQGRSGMLRRSTGMQVEVGPEDLP